MGTQKENYKLQVSPGADFAGYLTLYSGFQSHENMLFQSHENMLFKLMAFCYSSPGDSQ